jgi:tRNA (cytidine/uridine-2'-O-)-methyltransferase
MEILLYAPENPRNLGSIVRTSAGFGIPCINIFDKNGLLRDADAYEQLTSVCRRGRENRVEMREVADLEAFLGKHEKKYATVLSPKSKRIGGPVDPAIFPEDSLLIFGCESVGLPREISTRPDVTRFVIPTVSPVECFGLAEAYAIVVYEFLRQHPELLPRYTE